MSHKNLDQCFKTFDEYVASGNFKNLNKRDQRFMEKVKDEFTKGNVQIRNYFKNSKYSFNEIVTFLDYCKVGGWTNAKTNYHQAYKEYETFVKALDESIENAEESRQSGHSRSTTNSSTQEDAKKSTESSKSRAPRVTVESPIGGQSGSQTPIDRYRTSIKHTTGKTLATAETVATLSNQGQSVQQTSRNTNEYDSRNYKDTQQYNSQHHKDKYQYRMTDNRNDRSTWQEATPVSPMDKDLPAPDYHKNSESDKASIKEPEKTLLSRATSVSPLKSDPYSLNHDRRNKSDPAKTEESLKTDYDSNEAGVYRRSENASILLRENNPNIADLSDPNRPTKLAERFSELYSNEHTDTFEELAKCYKEGSFGDHQEREIVNDLLLVIKEAYEHCRKWNEEIDKKLASVKQTRTPNSEDETIQLRGQLLQKKKHLVKEEANKVVQVFVDRNIPNLPSRYASARAKSKYTNYARKTVEIVWWMCVQNPPIHLEYTESGDFDSGFYRSYTKSGPSVDFCVWPLVRLHENGPILSKGIAQAPKLVVQLLRNSTRFHPEVLLVLGEYRAYWTSSTANTAAILKNLVIPTLANG